MAWRAVPAGAAAAGGLAGYLHRAANWSVLARGRRADHSTVRDGRPGVGHASLPALSGRSLGCPAFANRSALHARTVDRSGCAVRLAALNGYCLDLNSGRIFPLEIS